MDLGAGLALKGSGTGSSSFGAAFGFGFTSVATRGTCGFRGAAGTGVGTGGSALGWILPRGVVALGDASTAWRTGVSLALGGEAAFAGGVTSPFGFATFAGALGNALLSAFGAGALALGVAEGDAVLEAEVALAALASELGLGRADMGLSGLGALEGVFLALSGRRGVAGDFASGVLLRELFTCSEAREPGFAGDGWGLAFDAAGLALAPALLLGDGEVGLLPFSGVFCSCTAAVFVGAFASF